MEENEKKDMNVYTFEKNENIDGNMVLVNVNGKLKNEFLKEINKNFSETGNYFKNANKEYSYDVVSICCWDRKLFRNCQYSVIHSDNKR